MNFKYSAILLLFTVNAIYAQCENLNESLCEDNDNCSWVEDLEWGSCSSLSSDACSSTSECNWEYGCIQWGSWYTWLCYDYGYECTGGTYQVDNGYCEEIMMPGCSELDQNSCNHPAYGDGCEWVEDITMASCSQFDNSENSCTDYPGECFWDEDITYTSCDYPNSGTCNSVEGCYWDCSDYGWYCDCYGQQQTVDTECIGQYEINNSYCDEIQYQMGDINGDESVDVLDIILIVSFIIDPDTPSDTEAYVADYNGDGQINILDIVSVVSFILDN